MPQPAVFESNSLVEAPVSPVCRGRQARHRHKNNACKPRNLHF